MIRIFLSFEFSAINYKNPSQTYFRYQLEGIDNDWRETTVGQNENSNSILKISYTNLPHGKYKLKVMTSNDNRKWDGLVSELQITIHAPWWKTPVAYSAFFILFIVLAGSAIYAFIFYSRKKWNAIIEKTFC